MEQIVVLPEIPKIQTVHGTQTSESLENSLVRQATQAVEMVEVESTISADSQAPRVAVDCVQPALMEESVEAEAARDP